MDISALRLRFRSDSRDAVAPYLWSDAEIWSYIDEAQKEFCRLTGGLADATSAQVAQVAVTIGVNYADVSPLILKIRAAFDAAGKKITVQNFETIEFDGSNGLELYAPVAGPVRSLIVGMEPNRVFFPVLPDASQTINLIVYRLPLEDIEDDSCDLEIDPQHHLSLLLWARSLAHRKSDAEAFDRGRADSFEAQFRAYCVLAADEKARREHKHRAVQFSW